MNYSPAPTARHYERPKSCSQPSSGHYEHTEVSYSRPSRGSQQQTLGGACCGAGFGVLLIVCSTVLLWMNEGVAVRTARSLDEAQESLWPSDDLNAAPVGALVHAIDALRAPGTLEDGDFGLQTEGLRLKRSVEVYQWEEKRETHTRKVRGRDGQMIDEKTTTYSYDSKWAAHAIDSSRFNDRGFSNPSWTQALDAASTTTRLPFASAEWSQASVWLETYPKLPLCNELRALAETETDLAPPALADGGRAAVLANGRVYSSRGCASRAEVGCVRLRWTHAPLEVVSLLAARGRSRLAPWPSSQGAGYEIGKVSFGELSAATMLSQARASNTAWTWIKRAGGGGLMWIGWGLVMGPASYIASWVPLLGSLVGCALAAVAFCAALAQALTVIAVAWIAHRPLLASVLLALVVVVLGGAVAGLRGASRKAGDKAGGKQY